MSFVIFDTEYTSWKGCQENGWKGNQKKEIVQIAALKVSDKLETIGEFNALCQPSVNPVLSDYFVNLTGITNEQVKKYGKPFAEVYKNFEEFLGDNICYSFGWGADYFNKSDGLIVLENFQLYQMPLEKNLVYRNIAAVLKELYTENNMEVLSQCSGEVAKFLGLDDGISSMRLKAHNALYDVHSVLVGLRYFYPRSVELMNILENKA